MMTLCRGLTVVTKTTLNFRKSFSTQNCLPASSITHDSGKIVVLPLRFLVLLAVKSNVIYSIFAGTLVVLNVPTV